MEHASGDDRYGGENLAYNDGGISMSPENVLTRWVDDEAPLPYGQNGHLTAALWRATHYVGCAISSSTEGRGCHIQVCRNSATGNCNINSNNWEAVMIADTSSCSPQVPCDAIDDMGHCV